MLIWIDEHLSRRLIPWLKEEFGVDAAHVSELGLSNAPDPQIFARARAENAILLTKDFDFIALVERLGPPPRLIWLTTGNSSTAFLKTLLKRRFSEIKAAFEAGETIVEVFF